MSVAMMVSSALLNPDHKYPSTLTWKYRASLQSLCINLAVHHFYLYTLQCYMCCSTVRHTVEPCPVISPTCTCAHRYASFCNALFSRMQSIPEKFMIHLTQLGTVSSSHVRWSTGMLNSLHVNPIQSYHLHARQYIDMHPFAMHRFQECKASLKILRCI